MWAIAAAIALALAALAPAARAAAQQQPPARQDTTRRPPLRDSLPQRRGARAAGDTTPPPRAVAPPNDSAAGASPFNGLRFRSIGPGLISGRITDIAVHTRDKKTWYVAVAAGGIWKTINAGTTWTPVFDNEASYSIGTVVVDPKNPNVVWVGTGENNAQRAVAYGDGVYKSVDGGRSWQNVGLKESEHIGKIVIDPRNSDVVYVAAQGPLSTKGGDRGLYKTTDGGKTWKKILSEGTWAGASDVVLDPQNPDILLATTWQRIRRTYGYIAGGPESGVWRSTDGGATWRRSQAGFGPPTEDLGRVGLAVSPASPDVVYAIAEAGPQRGGFYRSKDFGASWERMSGFNTTGLYYGELFADPHDVDRVYAVDVRTMVTEDAGKTFRPVGERNKHVDNHVVWIDPDAADHLIIGCDGGLYETFDRGQTYKWFDNLPLGQFYKLDLDNSLPFYRVFGGTQDNSSVGGPARTRNENGITNGEWFFTAGGDGFQSRVDPKDPNIVYAESQHGNLQRFNLKTGESVNIVPQPEPGEPALRWYWDSPLIVSPHSNTRLYFAAQRLYRSDDRGNSWRPVSPDLSRQINRNTIKLMDRVWSIDAIAKNTSSSFFGAIVSVAESPLKEGLLWVGTDDGLIQVSEDGGQTWRKTDHFPGVPDTTQVAKVHPSSHDPNTVYAAFDNHMSGDYKPYLLKSTDLGKTWTSIAGNLPARGTVYAVIDDPVDPTLLFAGTEFGLYFSRDGGRAWTRLRGGLPTIQVRDLAIHKRENDLVLATFGRGFYVLDDITPLRSLTPAVLAQEGTLLPVKRTPMYIQASPYSNSMGGDFYQAQNPPFGATLTYYLRSELRTRRAARQARERVAARRGEDVFYPPWDTLKVEDREEAPAVILTVSDAEGRVVRRLTGPVTQGIHRIAWDLRYPSMQPPREGGGGRGGGGGEPPEEGGFGRGPIGPMVAPGTYSVALEKRVDGVVTSLGQPQKFEVYMLDSDVAPRSATVVAFEEQTAKLQRAVLGASALTGEALERLQLLRRAIDETPGADGRLGATARALELKLRDAQESLAGDPTLSRRSEPTAPSLMQRLNGITGGLWGNTLDAPTATQRRQYEIVSTEFNTVLGRLKSLVETDLKALEDSAEAAGAPWTSGRVPSWKWP